MNHRYIIIDGAYGGTGVRDQFEGFIDLTEIPISTELKNQIANWVMQYPSGPSYTASQNKIKHSEHDLKGFELMKMISKELGQEYKVKYFSDLRMKELIEIEGGKIIEL